VSGKTTNEGRLKMSEKPEYNTFVFKGDMNKNENPFHTQFCGVESVAWSRGNAL
jgi:hypothetical protein